MLPYAHIQIQARRMIVVCIDYGRNFDIPYQQIILIRLQRHTTYILENFIIQNEILVESIEIHVT